MLRTVPIERLDMDFVDAFNKGVLALITNRLKEFSSVGHQNAIPRRIIRGFNLGSFWREMPLKLRSSDGFACPLDGRLHSRLLRSASPARSGSRCSSAATRRF